MQREQSGTHVTAFNTKALSYRQMNCLLLTLPYLQLFVSQQTYFLSKHLSKYLIWVQICLLFFAGSALPSEQ